MNPAAYRAWNGETAIVGTGETRLRPSSETRGVPSHGWTVNHGANWIVEPDIEGSHDRIDHHPLMRLVGKRVCDRRVLKLLRQWLKAGVLDGGEFLPSDQGVPLGGVISCVLANVVLTSWTGSGRIAVPAKVANAPSYAADSRH
jgi:hypothetical protein